MPPSPARRHCPRPAFVPSPQLAPGWNLGAARWEPRIWGRAPLDELQKWATSPPLTPRVRVVPVRLSREPSGLGRSEDSRIFKTFSEVLPSWQERPAGRPGFRQFSESPQIPTRAPRGFVGGRLVGPWHLEHRLKRTPWFVGFPMTRRWKVFPWGTRPELRGHARPSERRGSPSGGAGAAARAQPRGCWGAHPPAPGPAAARFEPPSPGPRERGPRWAPRRAGPGA